MATSSAQGTTKSGVQYVRPGNFHYTARSMRTSGPNSFDTETFPTTAGTINVQKNIPLLQPLANVLIRLKLRLSVSVSITDCPPEAIQALFSLIKIFGTHTSLGSEVPVQMSGEIAFALPALFDRGKGRNTPIKINGKYYTYDEILTQQVITPTFFTSGGSPYDIECWWILPAYPFGAQDFNALQYLWDARSWGQTLQVQFMTRDASATGAFGTTGTKTLGGFGGAGSPTIDINLNYANLGPALDASIAKAVVVRNSQSITPSLQANQGANSRLLLMQNKKTMNVLVKTGTVETGSNNVYASLSDSVLEQTILQKNTTPIRNLQYNDVTDFFYAFRAAIGHRVGYLKISATDGEPANNPHASIRANEWSASTQFNLASQVIGGGSTIIGEALQEYVDGEPAIAQMAGASAAQTLASGATGS